VRRASTRPAAADQSWARERAEWAELATGLPTLPDAWANPAGRRPSPVTKAATIVNPAPHDDRPDPPDRSVPGPATWVTWREALAVLAQRRLLRRTATIALVVGTILFAINQLDVVLRGDANAVVWVKSAVTYVVPFCVSCAGVLAATRQESAPPDSHASGGTRSESEIG
jgi:hypothetical protein